MVAIVAGTGLGLQRSSAWVIGSNGQLGNASFGRYGENVYVNAATGNLILTRTDEILLGRGLDDVVSRNYNSLATGDADNQDNWRLNAQRQVVGTNGDGSVVLYDWDGSDMVYSWDSSQNAYICRQGGESQEALTYSGAAQTWTLTDRASGLVETYGSNGKILSSQDADGNQLTYQYDASGRLSTVATADNEYTEFKWSAANPNNLDSVLTHTADGTLSRVSYTYDSHNRLASVTTDLTPADGSDSSSVTTNYTYWDVSGSPTNLVASITQTGGAELDIDYQLYSDGKYHVSQLRQKVDGGESRVTQFSYDLANKVTTITEDPSGSPQVTKLYYDSKGQLVQTDLPLGRTAHYAYDANGNLTQYVDANANATTYEYDADSNLTKLTQGGTVTRYSYENDLRASSTIYMGPGETQPLTTQYIYDNLRNLRFVVSPKGEVQEYRYNAYGQQTYSLTYRTNTFSASLTGTDQNKLTQLVNWVTGLGQQNALGTVECTASQYDFRGNVSQTKSYVGVPADGTSPGDSAPSTNVFYHYDQFGNLLSRQTSGVSNSEVYVYDGLGRCTHSVDLNGLQTTVAYNDVANTITVTLNNGPSGAAGLVELTTYNLAGDVTSYQESGDRIATSLISYKYDSHGNVSMVVDPVLGKTYYLYDAAGRKVAEISPTGAIVEYAYDAAGRLTETISHDGKLSSAGLAALQAANGRMTVSQLASYWPASDPDDAYTWRVYDSANRLIKSIDGTGAVTTYDYDAASNLIRTLSYATKVDVGGLKTGGSPASALPTANSAKDVVTRNFYDEDSRLVASLDGEGYLSEIVYNQGGEKVETIAYAGVTNASLRASGSLADLRTSLGSNPQSVHTRYYYDGRGLLVYTLDTTLRPTEYVYDNAGQVISTIAYAGTIALPADPYSLTDVGNAIHALVGRAGNEVTWSVYNGAGQLAYSIDAAGGVTGYRYDAAGNVVAQTGYGVARPTTATPSIADMDSWSQSHQSDGDNQTTQLVYNLQGQVVFTIDAEKHVSETRFDTAGHVVQTIRYADTCSLTNPTQATMSAWAPSNAANRVTQNAYNLDGQLIYSIDAEGYLTRFDYDGLGRTVTVSRYADRNASYNPDTGSIPGSAVQTHYTYDAAGRVATQITGWNATDASGADISLKTSFTYDGLGNVLTKTVSPGASAGPSITTTYDYDRDGRLLSETAAAGTSVAVTTVYTYGDNGKLRTKTVASGTADAATTLYEYDAAGRLWRQTAAYGSSDAAMVEYDYDVFGNVSVSKDGLGNSTFYFYDVLNRVTLTVDPEGAATGTEYQRDGLEVATTRYYNKVSGSITAGIRPAVTASTNDAVTITDYDKVGRVTSQTDAEGYVTGTTYAAAGNEVASVTRYAKDGTDQNATTSFDVDHLGRVTATHDAGGYIETYTLDAFGNKTAVINKIGGTTRYAYDELGRVTSETLPITSKNAAGQDVAVQNTFQYDAFGNLKAKTEAVGLPEQRTTSYHYDELGRVTEIDAPAVDVIASDLKSKSTVIPVTHYYYDHRGNVLQTVSPNGASTYDYYDLLNRRVAEINAVGVCSQWDYDDNSNVVAQRVYEMMAYQPGYTGGARPTPSGNYRQTSYSYDHDNRLRMTQVGGVIAGAYGSAYSAQTITLVNDYDTFGNLIRQQDGLGNSVWFYYDRLGRKIGQLDQLGYLTAYALDSDGNTTEEVRYAGRTTITPSLTSPSSVAELAGHLTATGDLDRITNFTYDRNGQRLTETRLNVAAWSIDAGTGAMAQAATSAVITYTYNGLGEVTSKTEATGDTTSYAYDLAGRQISITAPTISGMTSEFSGTTSLTPVTYMTYDGLNNLISTQISALQTPSTSRTTTYRYGPGGRLSSTTDAAGTTHNYFYDISGNLVLDGYGRLTASGAVQTEGSVVQYDALGRAVAQFKVASSAPNWSFSQGFSLSSGNITTAKYDAYGEVVAKGENGVWEQQYAYDSAGRLWKARGDDGTIQLYLYDANGDQTVQLSSSGEAWNWDSFASVADVVAKLNAAGSTSTYTVTYTLYDARGQATSTVQKWRQLSDASAPVDIVQSRLYNAFGEVTSETDARGYTTKYIYNTLGKITDRVQPQVSYTDESGVAHLDNPTQHYRYDLSGRLIGSIDAEGNLNKLVLLAGTGYGDNSSSVVKEIHADGGVYRTRYDIFGEAVATINEIGAVTTFSFDGAGNMLTQTKHSNYVTASADSAALYSTDAILTDNYRYDGLGERIWHWNSLLGQSHTETTDYDLQGRITKTVDLGGSATTYAYRWDASISTSLGNFGGWEKDTTLQGAPQTAVTKSDYFGHTVYRSDYGNHQYTYSYDGAGRVATLSNTAGANTAYTWYNTGNLEYIDETIATQVFHSVVTTPRDAAPVSTTAPSQVVTTSIDSGYWVPATPDTYDSLGHLIPGSAGYEAMDYDTTTTTVTTTVSRAGTDVIDTETTQNSIRRTNYEYDASGNETYEGFGYGVNSSTTVTETLSVVTTTDVVTSVRHQTSGYNIVTPAYTTDETRTGYNTVTNIVWDGDITGATYVPSAPIYNSVGNVIGYSDPYYYRTVQSGSHQEARTGYEDEQRTGYTTQWNWMWDGNTAGYTYVSQGAPQYDSLGNITGYGNPYYYETIQTGSHQEARTGYEDEQRTGYTTQWNWTWDGDTTGYTYVSQGAPQYDSLGNLTGYGNPYYYETVQTGSHQEARTGYHDEQRTGYTTQTLVAWDADTTGYTYVSGSPGYWYKTVQTGSHQEARTGYQDEQRTGYTTQWNWTWDGDTTGYTYVSQGAPQYDSLGNLTGYGNPYYTKTVQTGSHTVSQTVWVTDGWDSLGNAYGHYETQNTTVPDYTTYNVYGHYYSTQVPYTYIEHNVPYTYYVDVPDYTTYYINGHYYDVQVPYTYTAYNVPYTYYVTVPDYTTYYVYGHYYSTQVPYTYTEHNVPYTYYVTVPDYSTYYVYGHYYSTQVPYTYTEHNVPYTYYVTVPDYTTTVYHSTTTTEQVPYTYTVTVTHPAVANPYYTDQTTSTDVSSQQVAPPAPPPVTTTTTLLGYASYQSTSVQWDALNRMTSIRDNGYKGAAPIEITLEYDRNGNIRHRRAGYYNMDQSGNVTSSATPVQRWVWDTMPYYYDSAGNPIGGSGHFENTNATVTEQWQEEWYLYDSQNRVVTDDGTLTNGQIQGTQVLYDAAGERKAQIKQWSDYTTSFDSSGNPIGGYTTHYDSREIYDYRADGQLLAVSSQNTSQRQGEAPAPTVTALMAAYTLDAMGRTIGYTEYQSGKTSYQRDVDYNGTQIADDTVTAWRTDGTYVSNTTYEYDAAGATVRSHTTTTRSNSPNAAYNSTHSSDTSNDYVWWDSELQRKTTQTSDISTDDNTSDYTYDGEGHLAQVAIVDQQKRTISYVTNAAGQIVKRDVVAQDGHLAPHELHYYVNGEAIGDITNNGPSEVNYGVSMSQHSGTFGPVESFAWSNGAAYGMGLPAQGLFANGAMMGSLYASFEDNYDPINGFDADSQDSRYTAVGGENMATVAQSLWGDASLWYVLASANGLGANDTLIAGQSLIVPKNVRSAQNSASTYKVYDPNKAMGDTSPDAPSPQAKPADPIPKASHGGCGVFGAIILAVVAIVVTVVTAGAALAAFVPGMTVGAGISSVVTGGMIGALGGGIAGTLGAVAIGAAAGAVGSMVSQGIGVATGLQDQFNWGAVGMAAIGGGVGAGIGPATGFTGTGFVDTVARGVLGNVVTQGIGVATGLQSKFDWTGVAAAGVGAAAGWGMGQLIGGTSFTGINVVDRGIQTLVGGMASNIANAATRTLINGSDFGDNILAALPDTIAQTIGNMVAGGISSSGDPYGDESVQVTGHKGGYNTLADETVSVTGDYGDLNPPDDETVDVTGRKIGPATAGEEPTFARLMRWEASVVRALDIGGGKPINGGSELGNALAHVPLIGGLLGDFGDMASGLFYMATGNVSHGAQQFVGGLGGLIQAETTDVLQFAFGTVINKAWMIGAETDYLIFGKDSGLADLSDRGIENTPWRPAEDGGFKDKDAGESFWTRLEHFPKKILVPNYGMINGPDYGTTQLGTDLRPANQSDYAALWHDVDQKNLGWLSNQYADPRLSVKLPNGTVLTGGNVPTGAIGIGYALFGTPAFYITGKYFP